MPCVGPSESDIRAYERRENQRKFGKSWSNDEWTENAACALTDHVRHGTPLPAWATMWSDEHEAKDKARNQAVKNRKEADEEREYAELVRLERKFRGKVGGK